MKNQFKKRILLATALTGLGLLLVGLPGISSGTVLVVPTPTQPTKAIDPVLNEIIWYGTLAPSSHNAQMWQIRVLSAREIIVMLDQSNCLPAVDPQNREALISLGTLIENLVQAASHFQLRAELQILTDNPFAVEVAKLTFSKSPGNQNPDGIAAIINRHTIRTPFRKQNLLTADLDQLKAVDSGLRYFPLTGTEGSYIKAAIMQAMRQQTADDRKQREFSLWVRFSQRFADQLRDGITPEMLGLSGLSKLLVRWFYSHETVMSLAFRNQTVTTVAKQAANCSGFFCVTSKDASVTALINAGRTLERFWLKATELKIAVHPMSSVLEESPWRDELNRKLGIDSPIQLVLRVGYVKNYGEPVSKRRAVTTLIHP